MTVEQMRRIADEARTLAMECVNGTAPNFGVGERFSNGRPCCAGGHVQDRAEVDPDEPLTRIAFCESGIVFEANDDAVDDKDRQDRLAFPLLAFADAADDAADRLAIFGGA